MESNRIVRLTGVNVGECPTKQGAVEAFCAGEIGRDQIGPDDLAGVMLGLARAHQRWQFEAEGRRGSGGNRGPAIRTQEKRSSCDPVPCPSSGAYRIDTPPLRKQLAYLGVCKPVIDEVEHPPIRRCPNDAARGLHYFLNARVQVGVFVP